MFFFEGKLELYGILCLLIIPIIGCMVFGFFEKVGYIWFAPLLDIVLFLAVTALFFPYLFQDIAAQEYDFTTVYWLLFFVPIQLATSFVITAIGYVVLRKLRKAKR